MTRPMTQPHPLSVVHAMEAALGRAETDLSPWFHDDFVWRGNAGCGVWEGRAAYTAGWQTPFRATFSDRSYVTEHWMADGDWAACFGHAEATHAAPFLGIPATGQRVRVPYIDFWRIRDGKIAENIVRVDFASVAAQLGRDLFDGHGWEAFDTGRALPPGNADPRRSGVADPFPEAATPLEIIKSMEQGLERSDIDVSRWFHDDFPWIANTGCGRKDGLSAFERDWYAPFRAAFGDRHFNTWHYMEDGDWAACIGQCEARHTGPFMGIAPTGAALTIPYIDFWRIASGKIAENRVFVDFPHVLRQLGRDVFGGNGWDTTGAAP